MTFDAVSFVAGIGAAYAVPTLGLVLWVGAVELATWRARRARHGRRAGRSEA